MSATLEKVRTIVSDALRIGIDTVSADKVILVDLAADSLDALEILMQIETEFDIELDEADAEGVKTVGDLVRLVDEKVGG